MNETKGLVQAGLLYLWHLIQHSMIYKVLTTIYSTILAQWQNSRITSALRGDNADVIAEHSLWYRFISKITAFSQSNRLGEKVESLIEQSAFIKSASYLLHNILALNLKFIGYLAGVAVFINIVLTIFISRAIPSILIGGILIICFILSRIDVNFTSFFAKSSIVRFFEYILNLNFSFDFFYKTRTKGDSRIICAIAIGLIAGVISFFAGPFMAAAFVLGLTFMFLVLYKTMAGVFFTVFLAPIIPTMFVAGLCLLTLISFIIKAVTTRNFEWKFDFSGFLIVNLVAIMFIAALISFVPLVSLQIFAIYAIFISFYFVLINMVKTRSQLFALLTVFVISGTLVALYGIFQHYFGIDVAHQAWLDEEMFATIGTRVFSTLENPNVLGTYLLLVIPIAVALMWSAGKDKFFRPRNDLPQSRGAAILQTSLTKTLFAGIVGIMFITLIFTYSRGCWIAIMVSAAVFVTFVKGKLWGFAILAIPFIPIILSFIPETIIERITSIGNLEDTSSNYRLNIWLASITMIQDWWVSGVGLGIDSFMQVYPFYAFATVFTSHSHNLYLQILIELGIVGFFVFALVVIFAFKSAAHARAIASAVESKNSPLSVMSVAISAAIVGFLIQGLFDHALYNYRVFLMFWMVVGFASICKFIAKDEREKEGVAVD